jgi:DNA transformation protein
VPDSRFAVPLVKAADQREALVKKDTYLEFVIEQLSSLGRITARSMFGGHCLYCDGTVFALLAGNTLYLKVDDFNRRQFEKAGLGPFRPFEDKDMVMQYYQAPAELFESETGIEMWGRSALDAGLRAAAKRKPKEAGRRVRSAR